MGVLISKAIMGGQRDSYIMKGTTIYSINRIECSYIVTWLTGYQVYTIIIVLAEEMTVALMWQIFRLYLYDCSFISHMAIHVVPGMHFGLLETVNIILPCALYHSRTLFWSKERSMLVCSTRGAVCPGPYQR